jgi:hypothetical protein
VQRDIQPNEIDWVFCWRTSTGEVRPGARDTQMNGRPVPYQQNGVRAERGLRTIVRGRLRTCPRPPVGPRLDQQGAITRMCLFVQGEVTSATLVPARTRRELEALREAARAAVLRGDAKEWALAAIRARRRVRWAIHIGAPRAVVSDLARRIDAPWTLDVREKLVGDGVKGAQIFCVDGVGRLAGPFEADSVFDDAPLPAFAAEWRATMGEPRIEASGGGAIEIVHTRPTGRGAWDKWIKDSDGSGATR